MRSSCIRRGMRAVGFTLVEVLISLSLLSLLMLALTSAVRGMGQTEVRVERRIELMEDYRLAHGLLRQLLGQVSARTYRPDQVQQGARAVFFNGTAQSLQWVGVMPARYGAGGRHYLRLATESVGDGGQPRWVLRYAPWNGADTFEQWDGADALVLSEASVRASLQYRHAGSGEWLTDWPLAQAGIGGILRQADWLPDAVRIDLAGEGVEWPPLLLAVRANSISDESISTATFGGRTRR